MTPIEFGGRCACSHWSCWGDAGSTVMRAWCPRWAVTTRRSDGEQVCASCAGHETAQVGDATHISLVGAA